MATPKSVKKVNRIPRTMDEALKAGYQVQGSGPTERNYLSKDQRTERGTMEMENADGDMLVIPFDAVYTFGKPAPYDLGRASYPELAGVVLDKEPAPTAGTAARA